MSLKYNYGWIKDENGVNYAPNTIIDKVLTPDGGTLADELSFIQNDIIVKNTESKEYVDTQIATEKSERETAITTLETTVKEYTNTQLNTVKTELTETIENVKETSDTAIQKDSADYIKSVSNEGVVITITKGDGSTSTVDLTEDFNNKVDKTLTINGKSLSDNITLSPSDIGAEEAGKAEQALSDAKAYADAQIAEKILDANASVSEVVLQTANTYTDTQISNEVTARNEAITNLETTVTEKITQAVEGSVKDWNQNDENSGDFIKNRTHYVLDDGTVSQLDEKFIPDSIARVEYIDTKISETLQSNYDLWLSLGYEGTPNDFVEFLRGDSAYELWVKQEGNEGKTEEEFLDTLTVGTDDLTQNLNDAKAYSDEKDTALKTTLEQADATNLQAAKDYTDEKFATITDNNTTDFNGMTVTDTSGFLGTADASVNAQSLINNLMERISALEASLASAVERLSKL